MVVCFSLLEKQTTTTPPPTSHLSTTMTTAPLIASTSLPRCHVPDLFFSEESWEADLMPKIEQEASPTTSDQPQTKNEDVSKETQLRKLFEKYDLGRSYDDVQQYHASRPDFLVEGEI